MSLAVTLNVPVYAVASNDIKVTSILFESNVSNHKTFHTMHCCSLTFFLHQMTQSANPWPQLIIIRGIRDIKNAFSLSDLQIRQWRS
jgi:hypothetical protein